MCTPDCTCRLCGDDDGCGGRCTACADDEDCDSNEWRCRICSGPDAGTPDPDAGADGGPGDAGPVDARGCLLKTDCEVTQWCDRNSFLCKEMDTCQIDEQCALGHVCNAFADACECINDESCANWPDGKTECDIRTKTCRVHEPPTCNPPCNPDCKECVEGTCEFLPGKDCCEDNDCVVPPRLKCDLNTFGCIEEMIDECPPALRTRNAGGVSVRATTVFASTTVVWPWNAGPTPIVPRFACRVA
ncbi:MAG: hypothetical protein HY897_19890 [Deltaproteobacteria bacterium]|nr:hypothetical protein [Deltaproteobacteria bacterium]